jgi:hypothetical protein
VFGEDVKAIANLFLRAKHWQIFFLLFVVPTFAEFAAIGAIPTRIRSWRDFGPSGFLFLGAMVLYLLCVVAWLGSMGSFFGSIVKPELKMKTLFFRFALVYPVVYVPIFFLVVIPDAGVPVSVILPLHLACMVCLFYLLYFVSKNLVLAEIGKQVSFYDYAGPFFLLWFYPIGVWIIQPKVNRLYADKGGTEALSATSVVDRSESSRSHLLALANVSRGFARNPIVWGLVLPSHFWTSFRNRRTKGWADHSSSPVLGCSDSRVRCNLLGTGFSRSVADDTLSSGPSIHLSGKRVYQDMAGGIMCWENSR